MKRRPDGTFLVPPHLTDSELVAYLDGELPPEERDKARAHLESCWTCRSWMSAIQTNINKFVRVRNGMTPETASSARQRVHQFRERLARHASESGPGALSVWDPRNWLGWRGNWRGIFAQQRQALIAAGVVLCLLVVMFSDALNTRVSADTVLQRAATSESSHQPGPLQVTRAAVRIEHINAPQKMQRTVGTVTLLRDSQSPAVYVSAELASGKSHVASLPNANEAGPELANMLAEDAGLEAPIVQYLAAQKWFPDVSAREFQKLIAGRNQSESSAKKSDGGFELHYPFSAGHFSGISEARMMVDAHDYTPLSVSIFSQRDGGEYRFTRTSYSFERRTTELARLFYPMETQTTRAHAEPPSITKARPLSYLNSHASDAEVAVAEALHTVDACLGEEVNIFPMSDGSLLVQGLVDKPERRNAIRQALRRADVNLRVEIYLPRELTSGSELYNPPDPLAETESAGVSSAGDTTLADLSSGRIPLYDQLYRHFAKRNIPEEETAKQINAFSNEVVTLARQTFLHAWALRRLEREFSLERTPGLAPPALARVERMREDHRRWISTISHQQAQMLSELPGVSGIATSDANSSGTQDSEALLRLAHEQNDLVRSLFTTSTPRPVAAGSLVRLLSVLRRMGA